MNLYKLNELEFEFHWRGKESNDGMANSIVIGGDIEWDREKKKWRATISTRPDIIVYDDDSPRAAAKAILEWFEEPKP